MTCLKNDDDDIAHVAFGRRVVKRVTGEITWIGVIQVDEDIGKYAYTTVVRILLLYGGDTSNGYLGKIRLKIEHCIIMS